MIAPVVSAGGLNAPKSAVIGTVARHPLVSVAALSKLLLLRLLLHLSFRLEPLLRVCVVLIRHILFLNVVSDAATSVLAWTISLCCRHREAQHIVHPFASSLIYFGLPTPCCRLQRSLVVHIVAALS